MKLFQGHDAASVVGVVDPNQALTAAEEGLLQTLEAGVTQRRPVEVKYFSRHRGELEWRTLSCQRVRLDSAFRIVAVCHRADVLKWFRLEAMQEARLAAEGEYRARAQDEVDQFIDESVAGFHGEDPRQEHAFVVRNPAARWVKSTLRAPMRYEAFDGGIRVRVEATSVAQVARFVVTLGDAVAEVSPALAEEVRRLAEAALSAVAGDPS